MAAISRSDMVCSSTSASSWTSSQRLPHLLDQPGLDEPVPSQQHLQRVPRSGLGESHGAVGLVVDQLSVDRAS